jgi:hypothetical protein
MKPPNHDIADKPAEAIPLVFESPTSMMRCLLELAQQIQEIHNDGLLHRRVSLSQLEFACDDCDDSIGSKSLVLAPPDSAAVQLGGPLSDFDSSPHELRGISISVPSELELAREVVHEVAPLMPPERIDIRQFGALVCLLITGRTTQDYLKSPRVAAAVPRRVALIVDACIGYDESSRLKNAAQLVDLIEEQLRELNDDAFTTPPTLTNQHTPTTPNRPAVPESLGQFDLHHQVGRGGMGTVYRAYDRTLRRLVAVKVLSDRLTVNSEFVDRFQAEAAAAAKLTHPNIVPIYFIGQEDGNHFYAMQFIRGESLAERLQREPLPQHEAMTILEQLLWGLGDAHKQGLIHRDVKPGNIILDRENGRVMLTDFGLAQSLIDAQNDSGEFVLGTAEYMSPEQARGDSVDQRSDLYSVGVVLYQMLAGRTPFDGESQSKQMLQHVCEEPTSIRTLLPHLNEKILAVVDRLLAKSPAERFQSVDELLLEVSDLEIELPKEHNDIVNAKLSSTESPNYLSRGLIVLGSAFGIFLLAIVLRSLWGEKREDTDQRLVPHPGAIRCMAFSADGKRLVSFGSGDRSIRLWDAASGRLLKQSPPLTFIPLEIYEIDKAVHAVNPTLNAAICSADWKMETNAITRTSLEDWNDQGSITRRESANHWFEKNNRQVTIFAKDASPIRYTFSGDDKILHIRAAEFFHARDETRVFTVVEFNDARWQVVVLDSEARPIGRFDWPTVTEGIERIGVSESNNCFVVQVRTPDSQKDDSLPSQVSWQAFDLSTGKLLMTHRERLSSSAITEIDTQNLRVLIVGKRDHQSDAIKVLSLEDGLPICSFVSPDSRITSLAVSPNGKSAAFGDESGHLTFCRMPD